jgi:hypothetical protein
MHQKQLLIAFPNQSCFFVFRGGGGPGAGGSEDRILQIHFRL